MIFRKYRTWVLLGFDLLIVTLSYYLALWIRFDLSFAQIEYFHRLTKLVPYIIGVNIIIFKVFKMDKTLWRQPSVEEALRISIAVFFGFVFNFILIHNYLKINLPNSMHLIAMLISVLTIEFSRFLYRIYRHLSSLSHVHNPAFKKVLIVGAGDAGLMLLKELLHNKDYENNIIGFIDDNLYKKGKIISGFPILGTTQDLSEIIEKHEIELIYLAIPSASIRRQDEIIKECYQNNVEVKVLSSSSDMVTSSDIKRNIRPITIMDLLGRKEIELDNYEIITLIKNKIILVSGAGGSIGGELCRQIIEFKPQVLVMFDINENTLYDLHNELKILLRNNKQFEDIKVVSYIASIRDFNSLEHIFMRYKPDVVFHAAAHKHVPFMEDTPQEAIKNNIFGTYNLIELAKKYSVKAFVSISTDKAVNPTNVMGATKRFVEKMIQAFGKNTSTKFVSVRFGNVLGSNGSVVPLFQKQIEQGGPLTVTHKDMVRYFMTIPEAVSLVIQAATYGEGGEIFVLNMGEPVKILDIAEKMIRLAGFKPYVDINIIFTGLRPGEKLFEELLMNEEGLRPTANKLIYVAKPMEISERLVLNELRLLREVTVEHKARFEIQKILKEVVDTYQPDFRS